jgi:hypothetical protein
MQDCELYGRILGIAAPWRVDQVELLLPGGRRTRDFSTRSTVDTALEIYHSFRSFPRSAFTVVRFFKRIEQWPSPAGSSEKLF